MLEKDLNPSQKAIRDAFHDMQAKNGPHAWAGSDIKLYQLIQGSKQWQIEILTGSEAYIRHEIATNGKIRGEIIA